MTKLSIAAHLGWGLGAMTKDAYTEGEFAFKVEQVNISTCPYPKNTEDEKVWVEGFLNAEREYWHKQNYS